MEAKCGRWNGKGEVPNLQTGDAKMKEAYSSKNGKQVGIRFEGLKTRAAFGLRGCPDS
jgi:hypothetical protein